MKLDTNCQIEKLIADDETRSIGLGAYLDVEKKRIAATNGHSMVILPCEPEDGDVTGYVTADALTACRRAKTSIHANGALAVESGPTFPRPALDASGAYPEVDRVVPSYKPDADGTFSIAFNPALLADLVAAMGAKKSKSGPPKITLTFHVADKDVAMLPIVVTTDCSAAYGLLMPMRRSK